MFEQNFIKRCLCGQAKPNDIDDYVEHWRTHETNTSLRDFLGMTQYEYAEWLKYGNTILGDILKCREDEASLEKV